MLFDSVSEVETHTQVVRDSPALHYFCWSKTHERRLEIIEKRDQQTRG